LVYRSTKQRKRTVSEPRLYLYRKAGREVWDAEMWLSDGRRRVWRTGIKDKSAAMAAARVRLEALAAVQTVSPIEGVSPSSSAQDAELLAEHAEAPLCAAVDAQAGVERPVMQLATAGVGVAPASEERSPALQTLEKSREEGSLSRFDRWFFGDLASLWRARA
jgi:hypothetical protein